MPAIEQTGANAQTDIYWLYTDLNSALIEVMDAEDRLCWSGQYDTLGKVKGQALDRAKKRQGGLNNYQYAPNPITWVDPFVLKCGVPKFDSQKKFKYKEDEISVKTYPDGTS